ncbi:MAG: S-layer homology domain-containing protein [Clostridia bacterium]|nr:S-layer homology domain-containing protein [Clostridia bacterium]MCI2015006.1 S-layer homology domain-containing protein [Clostridia bacterium]
MIFRKKLKITKCFSIALSILLLSSSINLNVVYAASTITGVTGTSVDFNEMSPTPVLALPNLRLSSTSSFGSKSYVEFSVDSADAYDQLGLQEVSDKASISTENGKVSVCDGIVYLGNGSAYDAIGAVDSAENGEDGNKLKIVFKRTLPNANFLDGQTGTIFSDGNTLEGWTIKNGVYDLYGNHLNLRSNGTKYTSMGESTKPHEITGTDKNGDPYTYTSDWYIPPLSNSAWEYESVERPDPSSTWGPFTTTVSIDDTAGGSGGRSLKLTSKGNVIIDNTGAGDPNGGVAYGSGIEKFGSAFGPVVTSDSFTAKAGEKISIDWKAVRQMDDYEVYGYVRNVTTNVYTLVFYGRGASQPWTTSEGTIPDDGTYQFVFINGTYDQTGGYAVGSYLWIDNIQVYGSAYSADVAQQIALLVNYKCTSEDPESTRNLNVKFVDEDGESGAATAASTINIVNQFSHPPEFTATAKNPAYNNGSDGKDILFSNADATTIENTESFSELDLTATGIKDSDNEFLTADGTDIAFKDGTSGKTADNSIDYTVTTTGSSVSINFTNMGLHDSDMNTFIDNLKYKNTLTKLTPGDRVFELVKAIDSGANTGKSENETALAITSTVTASNVITDLASTSRTGTEVNLTWSKATNATSLKIQQSTDGGKTWSDSTTSNTLTGDSTIAGVTGLSPNKTYKFKLIVTGGDNAGTSNIASVGKSDIISTLLTSDTYTVSNGETSGETIKDVPYHTSKADLLANLTKNVSGQTIDSSNVHDPIETGDKIVVTAADGSTKTTYTITVKPKPAAEETPNIQIDYENAELKGFTTGAAYSISSTTGDAYTITPDSESADIADGLFGTDVSIVKKGDNITSSDSDEQVLTIPSRPSTPTATGVNETYSGGKDGKITGVDGTMEYSTDQKNWTSITESELTGLPNGTYYVRVKAVTNGENKSFASKIETVTVGSDDSVQQETPNIQFDFKNGQITGFTTGAAYTINGKTTTMDSVSLKIDDDWFGTGISIVKNGNGTTKTDSTALNLSVPAKPAQPSAEIKISKSTNSIAVINTDDFDDCEYSIDGKTWKTTGAFTGLESGADYTLYVRKKATDGTFSSVPAKVTITTGESDENTRTLSGTVTDEDSNKLSGVTVKLTKYGTDSSAVAQTTTDENGKYAISGLSDGVYSLVATKDGKTITKTMVIKNANAVEDITLPIGRKDTLLQVIGDTPSVAADNLDNMFTDEDQETAKTNSVKIKLIVEKENGDNISSDEKEKIEKKLSSEGKVGIYLDLKLQKIINDGEPESIQPPEGQKIKITIAIPLELQNKAPYSIIRMHDGTADIITPVYDSELQTLTFEADKFSTYTIAYTEKASSPSGGGSSTSYYTITASAGDGGSISPSGSVAVSKGEYKEFTITPDDGYSIDDVIVDGESVGAVENYSFNDIDEAHTIKAVFEESDTENTNKDIKENTNKDSNVFKDISKKDWFYNDVLKIYDKGIMQGISDDEFGPYISTTRGMIATIVYRIDKSDEKIDSTFTDVAKDKYYYTPIGWAEKYKVVEGYGNGKYGPEDKVTREQLVAILWRYAGFPETENYNELMQFTDYNEISDYAKPALEWASENKIITGKGNKILDPKGLATRGELARILNGYLEISEK